MNTDAKSIGGESSLQPQPQPTRRVTWRRVVLVVLGLAVAAHGYFVVARPRFRATAILRIMDTRPSITGAPSAPADPDQLDRFVRTQVNLLKSSIVLDRVLGDPTIARMPELREQPSAMDWL